MKNINIEKFSEKVGKQQDIPPEMRIPEGNCDMNLSSAPVTEDITVFLTTTKYTKAISGGIDLEEVRRHIHPICVAEQYVNLSRTKFRLIEKDLQKSVRSLTGGVFIDPSEKTVFVGHNPEDEKTGLVVYKDIGEGEASADFFDFWQLYKSMFFEFQVYRRVNNLQRPTFQFSLSGYWAEGQWKQLVITERCAFSMIPLNEIHDPAVGGSG